LHKKVINKIGCLWHYSKVVLTTIIVQWQQCWVHLLFEYYIIFHSNIHTTTSFHSTIYWPTFFLHCINTLSNLKSHSNISKTKMGFSLFSSLKIQVFILSLINFGLFEVALASTTRHYHFDVLPFSYIFVVF